MNYLPLLSISSLPPRPMSRRISRRPEKNCGLAVGKIAASGQPGRKKYAAKPPPKIRLKATFQHDVKKNWQLPFRVHTITSLSYSAAPRSARGKDNFI